MGRHILGKACRKLTACISLLALIAVFFALSHNAYAVMQSPGLGGSGGYHCGYNRHAAPYPSSYYTAYDNFGNWSETIFANELLASSDPADVKRGQALQAKLAQNITDTTTAQQLIASGDPAKVSLGQSTLNQIATETQQRINAEQQMTSCDGNTVTQGLAIFDSLIQANTGVIDPTTGLADAQAGIDQRQAQLDAQKAAIDAEQAAIDAEIAQANAILADADPYNDWRAYNLQADAARRQAANDALLAQWRLDQADVTAAQQALNDAQAAIDQSNADIAAANSGANNPGSVGGGSSTATGGWTNWSSSPFTSGPPLGGDECMDKRTDVVADPNTGTPTNNDAELGAGNRALLHGLSKSAQNRAKGMMAAQNMIAPIDAANNDCISKSKGLYDTLRSAMAGASLSGAIIDMVINGIVNAIANTITQSCNNLVAAAGVTLGALESRFNYCVPLPNFNFNAVTFKTSATGKPCNGAQLITYPSSPLLVPQASAKSPKTSMFGW